MLFSILSHINAITPSALFQRVSAVFQRVSALFQRVSERFSAFRSCFSVVQRCFRAVSARFSAVSARFSAFQSCFSAVSARFSVILRVSDMVVADLAGNNRSAATSNNKFVDIRNWVLQKVEYGKVRLVYRAICANTTCKPLLPLAEVGKGSSQHAKFHMTCLSSHL
ncbi:hypothetical protein M8C21_011046 [Ambrosia artemisiifolia]|uniref:Uncharacterized protein n=1 Tax=Ambrosia artemisiifolia TaxID=4212 RepID=A0AAD5CT07_AMBAR|nr:hypothetical protein M8C21_011046 [Ambrosia artemisiifolia]